jgi:uncharacterized membrane protein
VTIIDHIKLYVPTALVFLALDLLWLGVVAAEFYREQLGHLLRADVLWGTALAFYGVYVAGILVFAVLPGLGAGSLARTAGLGAFLGFVAYAAFDLTARALFRGFPFAVVAVDLAWGTVLTAAVASAGYGVGRWVAA